MLLSIHLKQRLKESEISFLCPRCGNLRREAVTSGAIGKLVYLILFHFGKNDEIRKEYLRSGC